MPVCPYCGENQNALKNHVRLSSGNGHGPSGQYPDDFDRASSGDPSPATDGGAGGVSVASQAGSEPPNDQEDDTPSRDEGDPESGSHAGSADPSGDVSEPSETTGDPADEWSEDSDTDDNPIFDGPAVETEPAPEPEPPSAGSPADVDGCPDCGGELVDTRDRQYLPAEDGTAVKVPVDYFCSECRQGFDWNPDSDHPGASADADSSGSSWLGKLAVGGISLAAAAGVVAAKAVSDGADGPDIPSFP